MNVDFLKMYHKFQIYKIINRIQQHKKNNKFIFEYIVKLFNLQKLSYNKYSINQGSVKMNLKLIAK